MVLLYFSTFRSFRSRNIAQPSAATKRNSTADYAENADEEIGDNNNVFGSLLLTLHQRNQCHPRLNFRKSSQPDKNLKNSNTDTAVILEKVPRKRRDSVLREARTPEAAMESGDSEKVVARLQRREKDKPKDLEHHPDRFNHRRQLCP